MLQSMIVAVLVTGCAAYAAWALMPAAARRALAGAMLRLPLPVALAARCRQAAATAPGCGCSGCDHSSTKPLSVSAKAAPTQTITFHPRGRRPR
jgi:hypothetical protein